MLIKLWPCVLLLIPLSAHCADKAKPADANPYKLRLQNSSDYKVQGNALAMSAAAMPAELASKPYAREIEAAAKASGLDPMLVHALIHVESRHRKDALSTKGAIGLMQVLPETAARFGVDKPELVSGNLKAGTRYLRLLIDRFEGRLDLALAAYNAGEGVVDRYRAIPPYAETQAYVPAVLGLYSGWRGGSHVNYMDGTVMPPASAASMRKMR